MNDTDTRLLRRAIEVARRARENGSHPFGALIADKDGNVLMEAENTVDTEHDCTGHAETNLMRYASQKFDAETLAQCTLYSSAEPCPMCAGAIFWGNVRRVVYGVGTEGLFEFYRPEHGRLDLHCRDVLAKAPWPIEVLGPALEDEAKVVHEGFWS